MRALGIRIWPIIKQTGVKNGCMLGTPNRSFFCFSQPILKKKSYSVCWPCVIRNKTALSSCCCCCCIGDCLWYASHQQATPCTAASRKACCRAEAVEIHFCSVFRLGWCLAWERSAVSGKISYFSHVNYIVTSESTTLQLFGASFPNYKSHPILRRISILLNLTRRAFLLHISAIIERFMRSLDLTSIRGLFLSLKKMNAWTNSDPFYLRET